MIQPRDRRRLLKRLAELADLDREMRRPGTLASPGSSRDDGTAAVAAPWQTVKTMPNEEVLTVMDLAKLSRLQRWILCAALDNRGSADHPEFDLYPHEILSRYFGFPVARYADESPGSYPGARRFDREAIGRDRYDAAQASASRTVRRLQARGVAGRRAGGQPPAT